MSQNNPQSATKVQQTLIQVWSELFAPAPVAIDSDFFALGGDSTMAIEMISRVGDAFAIEVAPAVVFERPTLAELAEYISREFKL